MSTTEPSQQSSQPGPSTSNRTPRGAACMNCRRRKLKCDTAKPVCGQCARTNRHDECEYMDGSSASRTQDLETNLTRLQGRIQELEQQGGTTETTSNLPPMFPANPPSTPSDDPPTELAQTLLQHFLPHADQVGFFLHKQRFIALATSPDARYRAANLSRALLYAVYSYGAHLSCIEALTAHVPALLNRAVEAVSADLGGPRRYPLTQTIQAEVILANYFFCVGRQLEGRYHCSAAVALVLSAQLHKIRSLSTSDSHSPLAQPFDRIEEGQNINAFWTVFAIDKGWCVASGSPSQLDGSTIDTPWPLDMEEYDQLGLAPEVRGSQTAHKFLHDLPSTSTGGTSFLALRVKAAALCERATRLATGVPQLPGQQHGARAEEVQLLTRVIDQFMASLPMINSLLDTRSMCHLLAIHTQTHAAMILLYRSTGQATGTIPERCVNAAKAAAALVGQVNLQQLDYVDPILAPLWTIVVRILIGTWPLLRGMHVSTTGSAQRGSSRRAC
ncbi:uncharacterized protein C8Q71DRAFT_241611 [Rhodofomes roseus]|uniref:Zn(2)-C6 fungal-type domain-containing protein n=1 Tax=Rhodofomes roseus TaxID=34475 RepID=A0ABQ8K6I0_9APHY|nr:uncharacterized protein C8Q71DRAFT_241611 [Rhodofomes roseus]KAH9832855.1 hypothetical protein C8Q71DRAFT_241611 [Rhodofomes roseus]